LSLSHEFISIFYKLIAVCNKLIQVVYTLKLITYHFYVNVIYTILYKKIKIK